MPLITIFKKSKAKDKSTMPESMQKIHKQDEEYNLKIIKTEIQMQ